ncbi:glycosyl hydrolase [Motilibacter aurantiacus]|uniref:glycosyl hydrolase n=1 Tax=Motilibacter aurantiacus TaxID=2714955 RepID=UPI00140DC8A7|nr:glycosyl hydrolase [Motilibacter aurantiacus]NHC47473.1 cellulase family glycosylhydrolase [Motilibacter aurantiacus]
MRLTRIGRLGAAAVTVAVAASLTQGAGSALAAPTPTPADYFGMHVLGAGTAGVSYPSKGTLGSVRLWDVGGTWAQLQPTQGTWDAAAVKRLDTAVAQAKAQKAAPLLVLGQTPTWASKDPSRTSDPIAAGSAVAPRSTVYWTNYVKYVVDRYYKKGVRSFQTWNEPNGGLFWDTSTASSAKDMAALNLAAYQVIHATTLKAKKVKVKGKTVTKKVPVAKYPGAVLVSPGLISRRPAQVSWLRQYFAQKNARQVDVIGLHLYPNPGKTPESTLTQLATVRKNLAANKLASKPVWVTEVSFGGAVGGSQGKPEVIAPEYQAAYVARMLLLARSNKIDRLYWYAWDAHGVLGVELTAVAGSRTSVTRAGTAWGVTRNWMSFPLDRCLRDRQGVYTCTTKRGKGFGYVKWTDTPRKNVRIKAPAATTAVFDLQGKKTARKAGQAVTIGNSPILITTSK